MTNLLHCNSVIRLDDVIPKEFSLAVSTSNQRNRNASVRIDLPVTARTTLRVYDALGRHVLTLLDEMIAAGCLQIEVEPDEFSCGVYFFRMEAGTFIRTCKVLLLNQTTDEHHGGTSVA